MKLYEITDNMRELQAMADTGELSAEEIKDTMDLLGVEHGEKVEACLKVRQSMLGEISAIDNEIERLTSLKKSPEKTAAHLLDYIKESMISLGKDKLDLGVFKVTLRKATRQLGEIDESKIPDIFFTTIPESKKLDKKALLKSAKESSVAGVELKDSARSLLIK